jgi:FMN reductase
MPDHPLNVLCVIGSLNETSVTRVVIASVAEQLRTTGCSVDVLDLDKEQLPLYDPDTAEDQPHFGPLQARVARADVFILGSPDYHGSISSALKNFLDHFWHEFAGKLFCPVVASHEKGLTVIDQLRTVARQCYAWALPYGVSFMEKADVANGQVVSDSLKKRIGMLVRDARVYGLALARQREADLAGTDPGFMERLRKK